MSNSSVTDYTEVLGVRACRVVLQVSTCMTGDLRMQICWYHPKRRLGRLEVHVVFSSMTPHYDTAL